MIIPIVRVGRGLKNDDKYHTVRGIVRGGGRGSDSYDSDYHTSYIMCNVNKGMG